MQRAVPLQPLSRQHKSALMTCLLIRKGVSKQASVKDMSEFLVRVWKEELSAHFDQEEKVLLPLLRTSPEGGQYANAIERDHDLWRSAMPHLEQANLNSRLIGNLADQLEQHIRFEERIVFPFLETTVDAAKLASLQLTEPRKDALCNTYPKKFWE